MVSVTADTNIYVSALNFGGGPDRVLDLARAGTIRLAISEAIWDELAGVLRLKFGWSEEAIRVTGDRIRDFTARVDPLRTVQVVTDRSGG